MSAPSSPVRSNLIPKRQRRSERTEVTAAIANMGESEPEEDYLIQRLLALRMNALMSNVLSYLLCPVVLYVTQRRYDPMLAPVCQWFFTLVRVSPYQVPLATKINPASCMQRITGVIETGLSKIRN